MGHDSPAPLSSPNPAARRGARRCARHAIEILEPRVFLHAGHLGEVHKDDNPPADRQNPVPSLSLTAVPWASTQKLPDLFPLADADDGYLYDYTLDRTEIPGRTLLRFTTAAANGGAGPLEMRGGPRDAAAGTQQVVQRIFTNGGGFADRVAGTFTFHPEHGHIHFDNFASYALRKANADGTPGAVAATGDKISFCLLDSARFNGALPGSPGVTQYENCEQLQGISVGWNDVYDRALPDQWVDVTDVPDGQYWLEVTVDPDGRIAESDETNNTTRIKLDLRAQATPLQPDRREANDGFAAATNLGNVGKAVENALSIHAPGNDDYFKFTAAADGRATVSTAFDSSQGDLDLELYDASRNRIAESGGTASNERLSADVKGGQTYYVRVVGFERATNPRYDLTVDVPALVSIAATDATATEPTDAGLFTVTRTGAANGALTVQYSVGGTASAGVDYQRLTGSVTMSVLERSKTFRVAPIDDTRIESGETVAVTLKAGAAYTVAAQAKSAMVTLADNDGPFTDARDQIAEASTLVVGGSSGQKTIVKGQQVQMYKFTAAAGRRVGFDVDRTANTPFDSYLRLFDSSGAQLASNDNGAAPGETPTNSAYLEYAFARAGTYYVGVSGKGNSAYNAITGTGDKPGSSGGYTLSLAARPPTVGGAAAPANLVGSPRTSARGTRFGSLDVFAWLSQDRFGLIE